MLDRMQARLDRMPKALGANGCYRVMKRTAVLLLERKPGPNEPAVYIKIQEAGREMLVGSWKLEN